MSKHETKYCPRCRKGFECKVGSVTLCQCSGITLTEEERDYLSRQFHDCLCLECMKALGVEFHNKALKDRINSLVNYR